jgi:hypothetical protein
MMKQFLRFELRSQLIIFFMLSMPVLLKAVFHPPGDAGQFEGLCICNANAAVI